MVDETPPPLPPQPASVAAAPRTEPLAIWSLVLSILSWFFCFFISAIPAIICGHIARSKIRKSNGALQGMNMAIAGLIIAYATIPFGVLGGIMLFDMIRSERARLHDLAFEKKEIVSNDAHLKVTTSGHWVKRTDLNKEASLEGSYKDKEMYVIIIADPKSTVKSMTLEQHHQLTRDHMLEKMQNTSATQPISVTIDNHRGLQDEISGTRDGTNLTFLHTTLDAGDQFAQILAWTLKSRWAANKSELTGITNSFHSEK